MIYFRSPLDTSDFKLSNSPIKLTPTRLAGSETDLCKPAENLHLCWVSEQSVEIRVLEGGYVEVRPSFTAY